CRFFLKRFLRLWVDILCLFLFLPLGITQYFYLLFLQFCNKLFYSSFNSAIGSLDQIPFKMPDSFVISVERRVCFTQIKPSIRKFSCLIEFYHFLETFCSLIELAALNRKMRQVPMD